MAKTNEVKLTLGFDDFDSESFTIEDVADEDLSGVKTKIKALNANYTDDLKGWFISAGGASSNAITAAQIIETDETVLFERVIPE